MREDNLLLSQLPGDQVGNSDYNEATEKQASLPRDSIEKESLSGNEQPAPTHSSIAITGANVQNSHNVKPQSMAATHLDTSSGILDGHKQEPGLNDDASEDEDYIEPPTRQASELNISKIKEE